MGEHEGGALCLRCSGRRGQQQRARERDITVFESDFFLADVTAHGECSGLSIGGATLMVQINYVNSPLTSIVAKGKCLPGGRGHIQCGSAGELSLRSWEDRAGLAGFHVGHPQGVLSAGKSINHYVVAV